MAWGWRARKFCLLAWLACTGGIAEGQQRTSNNAVTEAEDAFGFSVGLESLGIYNAQNARGFSPIAAGNVRIDGLYFDPMGGFANPSGLPSTLVQSTSIKVGLSAQGYPFAAPSGIVDQTLRFPADKNGASIVTNFDSYGSLGVEVDGSVNASNTLSIAYGLIGSHLDYPDGTRNSIDHTESLLVRWKPVRGIELDPFWYDYHDFRDQAGMFYVPAGDYLPKLAKRAVYEGPSWTQFRFFDTAAGMLGSAEIATNWLLRLGAFHAVNEQRTGFTNLLIDEQPDGSGERVSYADPLLKSQSTSGELRLTHSIVDGPRLHVINLSIRGRDARREFGGAALLDFGPGRVGEPVDAPKPGSIDFGEVSRDHLVQTTYGISYDGRWKGIGEISVGISQARFRKSTQIPGSEISPIRSNPWIYNGTAAANLSKDITIYAGYARGLEESGLAPANAANRNAPLPAIITEQKDAGFRFLLGDRIRIVAGLFDLSRPYFDYDAANAYSQVGTVDSRGAEFSISGKLTSRLDIVVGGVVRNSKVNSNVASHDMIGSKPVGLDPNELSVNGNWRTPLVKGLEFDATLVERGRTPATADNLVYVPVKVRVDLGSHYRFKLADRDATIRLQLFNLTNGRGYAVMGSGFYGPNPGRSVQGYLAVDL